MSNCSDAQDVMSCGPLSGCMVGDKEYRGDAGGLESKQSVSALSTPTRANAIGYQASSPAVSGPAVP